MRISILTLAALCAGVTAASAQAQNLPGTPRVPDLFSVPLDDLPTLKSLPYMGANGPARIRVRVLEDGQTFQIEVARKSVGDVLRTVTALMGARAVIDPELDKTMLTEATFRATSLKGLLNLISEISTEHWQSPSGTYFFAAKAKTEDRIIQVLPTPQQPLAPPESPQVDPGFNFNFNGGPNLEPPPEAEKREFNGRPYYQMPLPIPAPP